MLAAADEAPITTIEEFLEREREKELLRFSTAGSVDDGKSTLIGRLLYDSRGVYEDQLASVKKASANRSAGPIDFSLLTDGLRAEREQNITIDVAYRYFSTARRKFIIADTPGHEQYTRNMATGASTADLAVILVDARNGVLQQSRRHAYIAWLLGIPRIVVAVNKMDLVDFREDVFTGIRDEFAAFAARLGVGGVDFIPLSALEGDNVVARSGRTPWYEGPSLLEYLETVPVEGGRAAGGTRFPVQYVIRPGQDFRGYAGQLASGRLRPGDPIMVLPSGRTSRVQAIVSYDGDLREACAPMSITVSLEDDIDVSRGDMLVNPQEPPHVSRRFQAALVWMNEQPLEDGRLYLLKHTTQQVRATVTGIRHRVDVNTLGKQEARQLGLNDIGGVEIETHRPLFFDAYRENRAVGGFILIDPISNATVGAGMILDRARQDSSEERAKAALREVDFQTSRVTAAERYARFGHLPATVWLAARRDLAYLVERKLFDRGCLVHVLADEVESRILAELAQILTAAGTITICSVGSAQPPEERERARALVGPERFVEVNPQALSPSDETAANQICRMLEERGLIRHEGFWEGEGI